MDKLKKKEILTDLMTRFPQKNNLRTKEDGEKFNKVHIEVSKKRHNEKKAKSIEKLNKWRLQAQHKKNEKNEKNEKKEKHEKKEKNNNNGGQN